jgi:hypothetical protein
LENIKRLLALCTLAHVGVAPLNSEHDVTVTVSVLPTTVVEEETGSSKGCEQVELGGIIMIVAIVFELFTGFGLIVLIMFESLVAHLGWFGAVSGDPTEI